MTGNRIIYPADSREVSVQLTNRGDVPGVVQVWLDDGDAQSVPQTAAAPFVTTPPVFRMAAHAGQTVRLRYIGKPVAQDRESLWWFNFIQIPPINKDAQNDNQLLVLVRSRVKVLVRPKGLVGSPLEMANTSRIWLQNGKLHLRSKCRMASCIYAITVVSILRSRHLTSAVREKNSAFRAKRSHRGRQCRGLQKFRN